VSACRNYDGDWIEEETWQRVPPFASITLSWDGLSLEPFQTIDVCEPNDDGEAAQPGDSRCLEYRRTPAIPGAYSVTFGVRSTDPSLSSEAECDGERCSVPIDIVPIRTVYQACRTGGADTTAVAFELPEAGELVVQVALE
jgi:hypothetical protein